MGQKLFGSAPGYMHPSVVTQNNLFNHRKMVTMLVCSLTSNTKRAGTPGNLPLELGEAKLLKASVVLVSQIYTVKRTQLREHIGTISKKQVRQILDGVKMMAEPHEAPR